MILITALYVCACGYEQPFFAVPLGIRQPAPQHGCPLRSRPAKGWARMERAAESS